jgi:hypothetical protein
MLNLTKNGIKDNTPLFVKYNPGLLALAGSLLLTSGQLFFNFTTKN